MQRTEGFTIIEILIAIVLLAIIITVVMMSLTGSFKVSGNTTLQSVATNRAQSVIELIRGQWQAPSLYASACVQTSSLPIGTIIIVQDTNVDGTPIGSSYSPSVMANCSSAAATAVNPPLRRVTVTSTNTSGSSTGQSQLVLEIARP